MAMAEDSMDRLTDDILADIISRVPYKSTCCCKCVSTRWRDLITHPDHRTKMPQSLVGFFHESHNKDVAPRDFINALAQGCPPLVDPSLSFLPKHESLHILDGCNGLLLCCLRDETTAEILYYVVCNPSTEKWVVVPTSDWSGRAEVFLAFDPSVSSHFHVCELLDYVGWHWHDDHTGPVDSPPPVGFIVAVVTYSSKTGVWSHETDAWSGSCIHMPMGARSVFFKGELHFCDYDKLIAINVEENNWKAIPLPAADTYIASDGIFLSHGQVQFAYVGPSELSIWVLEDSTSEIWTLKRNISHLQLFGTEYSAYEGDYSVFSIHPEDNLIFIVAGPGRMKTIMSYEMDSMKRCIIRQLGSVSTMRWGNMPRCIPYVPCFLKSLADGH